MAANAKSFSQTMLAGALPRAIAQKTHASAMEFSRKYNRYAIPAQMVQQGVRGRKLPQQTTIPLSLIAVARLCVSFNRGY